LTIGLVAALPAEIRCLTSLPIEINTPFQVNKHLVAIVCGIGAKNAARATQYLLYQNIQGLISWGTAGSLSSKLKSGDLVLPDVIQATNGRSYHTDNDWLVHLQQALKATAIRIHTGLLVETNIILGTDLEKTGVKSRTSDAIATDMETAAVMKIGHDNGIPGIAIRSIVDQFDDQVPGEILKHTDGFGTTRISNLLVEIMYKPQLLAHLFRLSIAMRAATRTLRSVATVTNETFMYIH